MWSGERTYHHQSTCPRVRQSEPCGLHWNQCLDEHQCRRISGIIARWCDGSCSSESESESLDAPSTSGSEKTVIGTVDEQEVGRRKRDAKKKLVLLFLLSWWREYLTEFIGEGKRRTWAVSVNKWRETSHEDYFCFIWSLLVKVWVRLRASIIWDWSVRGGLPWFDWLLFSLSRSWSKDWIFSKKSRSLPRTCS